jgi:hypothetical protein
MAVLQQQNLIRHFMMGIDELKMNWTFSFIFTVRNAHGKKPNIVGGVGTAMNKMDLILKTKCNSTIDE